MSGRNIPVDRHFINARSPQDPILAPPRLINPERIITALSFFTMYNNTHTHTHTQVFFKSKIGLTQSAPKALDLQVRIVSKGIPLTVGHVHT